jgi:CubicO group peptidase (beta-lactamase class C family)
MGEVLMPDFDEATAARVRSAARQAIEERHLPGIAIGIVERGDLVFAEGFGYADIEAREPQDPARRQRIASITKTMTGLCLMALVDEGRLSLDDRVMHHLPEIRFDGPAPAMTLRHLLTHTSGIGEAPTDAALAASVSPDGAFGGAVGDFSTLYPDGIVVEARPGAKWAYCNNGYALLGEILVRTEAASLHDIFQRRIFGPLDMADTDCLDEPHPALTTGYHRSPSADTRELYERAGIPVKDEETVDGFNVRGTFVQEPNTGNHAAGAVQSTVHDMARYAAALLDRGAGIVQPGTFDLMTAPHYRADDSLVSWGLAFSRSAKYGVRTFGHGGAFFGGWNSNLAALPDQGVAVIQHMNVMLDSPAPVFNAIIRAVLGAPEPVLPRAPISTPLLDEAAGIYECLPGRLTNFRPATRLGRIRIEREGAHLMLTSRRGAWKAGGRMFALDPAAPMHFFLPVEDAEPARLMFTRDALGHIDGFWLDDLVRMVRGRAPAGA